MFGIRALKERVKRLEDKLILAKPENQSQERNSEGLLFLGTSYFEYNDNEKTYSDSYLLEFLQDKETGNVTVNIVTVDPAGRGARHPWYLALRTKLKYENTIVPIYDIHSPSQYLIDLLQSKGYIWNHEYNFKTRDAVINWIKKDVEPEKSPE